MLERIFQTAFTQYIWTRVISTCLIGTVKAAAPETVAEPTLTEARP